MQPKQAPVATQGTDIPEPASQPGCCGLSALEAMGEALAALEGCRERFREGDAPTRTLYGRDAAQAVQHLANSGWMLVHGGTGEAA